MGDITNLGIKFILKPAFPLDIRTTQPSRLFKPHCLSDYELNCLLYVCENVLINEISLNLISPVLPATGLTKALAGCTHKPRLGRALDRVLSPNLA